MSFVYISSRTEKLVQKSLELTSNSISNCNSGLTELVALASADVEMEVVRLQQVSKELDSPNNEVGLIINENEPRVSEDIEAEHSILLVGKELLVYNNNNNELANRVKVDVVCEYPQSDASFVDTEDHNLATELDVSGNINSKDIFELKEPETDSQFCFNSDSSKLDFSFDLSSTIDVSIQQHDKPIETTQVVPDNNNISQEEVHVITKNKPTPKRKRYECSVQERKRLKFEDLRKKHTVQPPCENCKRKCLTKIDEHRRSTINNLFWSIEGYEDRRRYIFNCCERFDVKKRTVDVSNESELRRNKTVRYFLTDQNDKKHEVCKTFFLTTFGFHKKNDKFLNTILSAEKGSITPSCSKRGRHPSVNKGPNEEIILHIESFNPEVAHYRREHAPNKRYLPSDLNIVLMHNNFVDKNPQFKNSVSYDLYRKLVRERKISFARLGNEECEVCEEFKLHEHNESNLDDECEICSKWKIHIKLAKDSRELYRKYAENETERTENSELCVSADLEKVIMLPRLEMFKQIIFAPRLTTYNQTFAPVGKKSKQKPFAVLWHSALRGRNKEEMVSTFYAFFRQHRDIKKFVLWLDNCSAQNKNWCLLSFLVKIVNSLEVEASEVNIFYFEPGHSFNSADSFHHQVECSLKQQKKTYDFDDFVSAVGKANRGHVDILKMELKNFFEWKDWKSDVKLKSTPERVFLRDIVHIKAVRGNFYLQYKTSYEEVEEYKILDFLQNRVLKKGVLPDPKVCTVPQGFPKDKKIKLLDALKGILPVSRKIFWETLPTSLDDVQTAAVPRMD